MNRIFISYSSKEYDIACRFRQAFSERGIICWMAPESIPIGSNYAVEIPKAIQDADIFVLILSDNSQNSVWVRKEIDLAVNLNKLIFPIKTGNYQLISPFSFYLTDVQMMQANDDPNVIADKLCSLLNPQNDSEGSAAPDSSAQQIMPKVQPTPMVQTPQFDPSAPATPEKNNSATKKLVPIIAALVVSIVVIVCTVILVNTLNSKAPQAVEQNESGISETTVPTQTTSPESTTTSRTETTTKKPEITTTAPKQEYNTYFAIYYDDNEYFNKYDIDVYVDNEYYGSVTQGDNKLFRISGTSGKYVIKVVNSNKSSKYDSVSLNMDASEQYYYAFTAKAGWTGIHLDYAGLLEFQQ